METVEDFNYVFQPSLRRDVPVRLATATFIPEAEKGYPALFDTAAGRERRRRITAGNSTMSCGA